MSQLIVYGNAHDVITINYHAHFIMSVVAGEDSESSEDEINTDLLSSQPKGSIRTGEEEEDEEGKDISRKGVGGACKVFVSLISLTETDTGGQEQVKPKEVGGADTAGGSPSLNRKSQWTPPS